MSVSKTKTLVIKQNIGVDISKDDFKTCVYFLDNTGRKFIKGTRSFKNTLTGFTSFMDWVEKKRNSDLAVHVTMEATGVYHENLAHFLNDNSYVVNIVLANQAKAYAKSLNLKSKTDAIDAKMLGQMGIERALEQWQPISDNMRVVKQLSRDRVTLLEEKTAISNRLHALNHSFRPDKSVIKRIKQRLALISKQLAEVERQIQSEINKDEVLQGHVENICKIKGLGMITVATILAETNGFALFTSRSQLISYAGLDVVERTSGKSVKGKTRISKKGNGHIRRALYFPAISAAKHEPNLKKLFDRVLEKSHIKMKAYVAVQRKLLLLIYALFKNNTAYDSDYLVKKNNELSILKG